MGAAAPALGEDLATSLTGVRAVSNISKNSQVKDVVKVTRPEGRRLYLEQNVKGAWTVRKTYELKPGDKPQSIEIVYPGQWKERTYTSWRIRIPKTTVKEPDGKTSYAAATAHTRVIAINVRPCRLHSRAGAILDADGYVVFSKNRNQRRPIASTTKVMTALLAIERLGAKDTVTYNRAAEQTGYRSYWAFSTGTKFTRAVALRGMLVPSSNDFATAIACQVAGSNKKFARLMTAKARELGLTNTSFKNPHGLPAKGHYSTAYDMAQIMRHAYAQNAFRTAARRGTTYVTKSANGRHRQRVNSTWAALQRSTKAVKAGKTGYTNAAGRCFVGAYATRKGTWYIATLGSYGADLTPRMWKDQRALLAYARQCR